MTKTIAVVYENGMLRPLETLQLPEGSILTLQVLSDDTPDPFSEETASVRPRSEGLQALIDAGIVTPYTPHKKGAPLSKAARRELADRLGRRPGKPLSEVIIEDRGPL